MAFAVEAKAFEKADGIGVGTHCAALGPLIAAGEKTGTGVAHAPAQHGAGEVRPCLRGEQRDHQGFGRERVKGNDGARFALPGECLQQDRRRQKRGGGALQIETILVEFEAVAWAQIGQDVANGFRCGGGHNCPRLSWAVFCFDLVQEDVNTRWTLSPRNCTRVIDLDVGSRNLGPIVPKHEENSWKNRTATIRLFAAQARAADMLCLCSGLPKPWWPQNLCRLDG